MQRLKIQLVLQTKKPRHRPGFYSISYTDYELNSALSSLHSLNLFNSISELYSSKYDANIIL